MQYANKFCAGLQDIRNLEKKKSSLINKGYFSLYSLRISGCNFQTNLTLLGIGPFWPHILETIKATTNWFV
jgi:hypothetical protein